MRPSRREMLGLASGLTLAPGAAIAQLGRESGIQVDGSKLFRDGKEFRAMGCNFYDLLTHDDFDAQIAFLRQSGIPFLRFDFGSYGAGAEANSGWRLFFSDKSRWLGRREAVVESAEKHGVGLIPSMFWRLQTIPDLMKYKFGRRDALSEIGNEGSNSRRFIADLSEELSSHFRSSSAILGWEIGNEYAEVVTSGPSRLDVAAGGPAAYELSPDPSSVNGRSDEVHFNDLFSLYQGWVRSIRAGDPSNRFISSGSSIANVALNGFVTGTHHNPDSFAQWMHIPTASGQAIPGPLFVNPRPFNAISTHIYQQAYEPYWYFNDARSHKFTPASLIGLHKSLADADNRVLFLGEFGAIPGSFGENGTSGTDGTEAGGKIHFQAMLDAIISNRVQLSSVWNYGFAGNSDVKLGNIGPGTNRAYMLEAIPRVNDALRV